MDEQYCLKWNSHTDAITDIAYKFLEHESLVDVTLVCQEHSQTHFFKAHQIILSACSPYFESLFLHNTHPHPIVFLKDIKKNELEIILTFMYRGEVNVHHDKIQDLLDTAKSLMVRGLCDNICEIKCNKEVGEVKKSVNSDYSLSKKRKCVENDQALSLKVTNNGVENLNDYDYKYSQCTSPSVSYNTSMTKRSESMEQMNSTECDKENPMDYSLDTNYRDDSCNQNYQTLRGYEEEKMNSNQSLQTSHNAEYSGPHKSYYYLFPNGRNDSRNENPNANKNDSSSNPYRNSTSQEISVIQANCSNTENTPSTASFNVSSTPLPGPKRVGHFQLKWMELFNWLQYDKEEKKMFCKFCRKWGDLIPNIRRTSFVDGSCNFRFEIVKHHDCSKSHRMCVDKEGTNNSVTELY